MGKYTIDKRTLSKLSYTDLYNLIMIIDNRIKMLENSLKIDALSVKENGRFHQYLVEVREVVMKYIDDRLKKIGGYDETSVEKG